MRRKRLAWWLFFYGALGFVDVALVIFLPVSTSRAEENQCSIKAHSNGPRADACLPEPDLKDIRETQFTENRRDEVKSETQTTAPPVCQDVASDCFVLETHKNACLTDWDKNRRECPATCGLCFDSSVETIHQNIYSSVPQSIPQDTLLRQQTVEHLAKVNDYMYNGIFYNRQLRNDCRNQHHECTFWASQGECTNNPSYMKSTCAPSCLACEDLLFENRCVYDDSLPKVWEHNNAQNEMFQRIVDLYNPVVLSAPTELYNENTTTSRSIDGPWLMYIDDFLTPQECETLIQLGQQQNYQRSVDTGKRLFDGSYDFKMTDQRTSTNAWCTGPCDEHNVTRALYQRMEDLIHISNSHYEYLQLLRYEVGQFYAAHHDYVPFHLQRSFGVRILTVFFYLNTVEKGGGTHFPQLGITIQPKQGRVVLWPSVYPDDPDRRDLSTEHEALPVEVGVKYAANAWVHRRDFKTPFHQGCSD